MFLPFNYLKININEIYSFVRISDLTFFILFLRPKYFDYMTNTRFIFWFTLLTFHFSFLIGNASAYRIEVVNQTLADMPVFLIGYYGERMSVIDSTMADAGGRAVFEREYYLCAGMYTVIAPGKLQYDLLLDAGQQLRLEWLSENDVSIEGNELVAVWAEYQALKDADPDRKQLAEQRQQIINQYPETFLATYLTALQTIEPPEVDISAGIDQLMREYRNRRRNFFANMPLSDVRLLRTPIYHETVHYFINQFVTQHTDSLIHIAYSMLEQASENYETFFYISDFLIDFYILNRNIISNSNRFYNFFWRNRDMLGTRGMAMLPPRSGTNYFPVPNEVSLQNRLKNIPLTDIEGQIFNSQTINSRFRVYYFWKNNCPRCIADASRLQNIINRYSQNSFCIAVNINNDVKQQENRIMAYDPLFVNVSALNIPHCETVFFATYYSKIIVTDASGAILGLFGSLASLDSFLRIAAR